MSGATYKLRNATFRTFPTFCKKSEVIRADDRDEKLETQKSYDCVESLRHGTSCFKLQVDVKTFRDCFAANVRQCFYVTMK